MIVQYSLSYKEFPKLVIINSGRKKRIWIKQRLKDKEHLGDIKLLKELETSVEDDLCNFFKNR